MNKTEQTRKLVITKYLENTATSYNLIARQLKMSPRTVGRIINRFKETASTARKSGSGRKSGFIDQNLSKKVVMYAQRKPSATLREIGCKFTVSHTWVRKVLLRNGLKAYTVQKHANRNDVQAIKAKKRARKLYDNLLRGRNQCIVMDDETYVVGDFKQLPGRAFYYAKFRFGVQKKFKYKFQSKFPTKYMVWQAICSCGKRSRSYIAKGSMKSDVYINECLKNRLLPFLNSHNTPTLFWPDLASCHYSKKTLEWYSANKVNFVPLDHNPPNCPHLRPVERYWAFVKNKLLKTGKVAKNYMSFAKLWTGASEKISDGLVKRIMAGLNAKINNFSRESVSA